MIATRFKFESGRTEVREGGTVELLLRSLDSAHGISHPHTVDLTAAEAMQHSGQPARAEAIEQRGRHLQLIPVTNAFVRACAGPTVG